MSKKVIINANMAEEIRIAITENGKLIDLDIETQSRTKHKGNVYKGIISNIEDSLDAAFVDIGEGKQAFLALTEVRPEIYGDIQEHKKLKISDILSRGQEIVVQVTKDEMGTKGAAVSTYLSLPGRYAVIMHSDEGGGGISRKINTEHARQSAREILARLEVPEGMAVIIRTAGMSASSEELLRDFTILCNSWEQINKGAQLGRAPTLLYREPDLIVRTIRDYFSKDVEKVVIDDEEEFTEAENYFKENMPDMISLLERFKKKEPIFQYYSIEKSIDELFEREVQLPSGGSIVIEQTEALVAIDVNSGRSTKEEDHEATVYKTNLEATEEIARQLRLRDLGGIIIIDFIDMLSRKHRQDVERKISDVMRSDKARVKIGHIGINGTLELTRQRLRQSHRLISQVECINCGGTGRVRDAEGLAISALRQISGYLAKKRVPITQLIVRLPINVANSLNNKKRGELVKLSEAYQVQIDISGEHDRINPMPDFEEVKRGQAGLDATLMHVQRKSAQRHDRVGEPKSKAALSIGPTPSLMSIADMPPAQDLSSPTSEYLRPVLPKHYDDPLTDALFGTVVPANRMDIALEDTSTEEEDPTKQAVGKAPEVPENNKIQSGSEKETSEADKEDEVNDSSPLEPESETPKAPLKKNNRRRYRKKRPVNSAKSNATENVAPILKEGINK